MLRFVLAAIFFLPTAAHSNETAPNPEPIEAVVLIDGQPAPSRLENGYRTVLGPKDKPFSLQLSNTSSERLFLVVAVDGKNPHDYKPSHLGQRGYILEPGQRQVIHGWKHKKRGMIPFSFTSPSAINYALYRENLNPVVFTPWSPHSGKPKPFYAIDGEKPRLRHLRYTPAEVEIPRP